MKNTKTVTVLVLVKVGSKYETKGINGISHFLEHLLFKGTKKRPTPLAIAKELDSVGGKYNAFTGKEYTGFYIKLASEHLNKALDVLSDILTNSLFKKEQIEKEKNVITQEINLYQDTPTKFIGDLFEKLLYGDQPAGWKIIGSKKTVQNLSRKQLISHFDKYYSANNSVIGIAGNVEPKPTLKRVKNQFNQLTKNKDQQKKKTKQQQQEPQTLIHKKDTDQSHLSCGVRTPDMFSKKTPGIKLISTILGKSMSSRLFTKVREKMGACYYINTGTEFYQDSGYLTTRAGVSHEKITEVIKAISKEYKKISTQKPPEKELNKAKEYIKGRTLIELEESDSKAQFLTKQKLLKKEIETVEKKFKKLERFTPAKIKTLSKEIFQNSRLNLALIGPFESEEKFKKTLHL